MHADPHESIRPAATVLIIRDGSGGVEVVTMKRSPSMRFLPEYLSFPGGSLQGSDWELAATRVMGTVVGSKMEDDLVYAIAAVRETGEEIGWLPAVAGQAGEPVDSNIQEALQTALLLHEQTLSDILVGSSWWVDAGKLRFVGRWVTPEQMPVRFDTRFFVVDGLRAQDSFSVNESENRWAKWCRPKELLAAIGAGRQKAVSPTIAMLEALANAPNVAWCLESLMVPGPIQKVRMSHGPGK